MVIFANFFRRIMKQWRVNNAYSIAFLTITTILIGTFFFSRLEGWTLRDSLYVTIITITTIGYGDITPSTPAGRTFAIVFSLIAIGIAGYAISSFAATLIETRAAKRAKYLRKRRMKRIEDLKDHYILCGANLVGLRIAEEFTQKGVPFIIIEEDEALLKNTLLYSHPDYFRQKIKTIKEMETIDLSEYEDRTIGELAEMLEVTYILEHPTDDVALFKAGIGRAKGLIAAMPGDLDNLSIVVGAKALANRAENTDLRIMARAEDNGNVRKLYLAGADFVRIPAISTGFEMALHMMHPEIGKWWYAKAGADRIDNVHHFQQVELSSKPEWLGWSVTDLHQRTQTVTMGVKRNGTFQTPPPADLKFERDDILIVIGTQAF